MKYLIVFFAFLALAFGSGLSDNEEYDCITSYLKMIKILPENFGGKAINSKKCDEVLKQYKSSVFDTYSTVFKISPKTSSKIGCVMENFQQSSITDNILLKFIYENARGNQSITKKFFCTVTKENDEKIEEFMRKIVTPCVPDFMMASIFDADAAAEECRGDNSSEFKTKVKVILPNN